jgi:predicted transcriptional regulator
VFNIFASLAEFERDLIIERTRAGLAAARARGRKGGRPKGLSAAAEKKAVAAESLYKEGRLSVNEIAENLGVSKATLYKYLRHRSVEIGTFRKSTSPPSPKTLQVAMHLVVENNNKFVRGKKRSREEIEQFVHRTVRPRSLQHAQAGFERVRFRVDDPVRERQRP